MLENISTSLAAGSISLILIGLLTTPSVINIASHLRQPKSISEIYEDKDGVATERSVGEYSAKIPKTFLGIFTISGLASSIALAVLSTIGEEDDLFLENWFNVAQWFLVLVQITSIISIRDSVKSYNLGLYSVLSSILLLAVLLYQDGLIAQQTPPGSSFGTSSQIGPRIAQLGLAGLVAFSSVSLPRRPEVFQDGVRVDGMYTVSALGKYTFSWVEDLLTLSRRNNRLELTDLPKMDHYTRSKDLSEAWAATSHERRLWLEIFLEHKWSFMAQWFLTLIQAFGNFAPQFVTYHILKILEKRLPGDAVSSEAWIWVVTLTIATIGAAWIESWLFWISWSEVAIPIRSQMAALIFQKAMRRKDVKGASQSTKKGVPQGPDVADASQDAVGGDKPELPEEDDEVKGKQSTVNLIGVDAKRVSDFCSFNNYFPGSLFKLIVSFAFLLSIIGWQSLLCGFLAMSLTIPLNIFFSKRYAAAQDRLMKVRDTKMGVVTEALQGIRQIKFSALEANWHEKIGKVRRKELDEQWNVFVSDTFLLFCWISSPIALAATSLAVYAWRYGELTPSVAFTAIGVFASLEVTLAIIPELTTDLIDAWISVERIEKYLTAPEISKNISYGPNISFEDASIAWPSDEEKESDDLRYVLRNINVSFPKDELSVVSGKTGTGKSLLLAAILGEVDLLSGKISVPKPLQTKDRHDHLANKENWIIPSSVAFVAQIPWIENASIKDNILFGLPYDEYRYEKVIEVCALKKDLEMLTDGESTEIGANGINLSGGQRWRVTFARALYSRAGILVLDDIFSAVDAHVGRFIFEKGLTGELGVGRTRILVTHHVALCASKTKYIVELGDGTIAHAGLVSELKDDGILQKIISHEQVESEQDAAGVIEDEDPTAVNSEESSEGDHADIGEALKKVDSRKAVKKFVEDELREQGRVKTRIYLDYMKYSGGWPFWMTALFAFSLLQILVTGRSWWIRIWTGNNEKQHTSMTHAMTYSFQAHDLSPYQPNNTFETAEAHSQHLKYYLGIYIAISIGTIFVGLFRYYFIYTGSIRASRRMFDSLSFTILRTPLRWMDTVPLGRILNRFTADFNVVDSRLANDISFGANNLFRLMGVIVAGIFVSPYVILLSVTLLAICIQIARIYISGAREVKRLESNAKSPVFEQFGSALTGVGTIRAFDKCDVYIARMFRKIDDHSTSFWHLWAFNRWMGWRMSAVGGLFATFVAIMILLIGGIDASLAGFALSFALEYGQVVIWTIRHYTNLELDMNAAERIIEYSNLPTESLSGVDPPAAWPSEGRLEVNDLVVGYAPDLPPVLKGLTFSVKRNERIGVVGRTGAGKSSLTLALFRFLEAREGSIYVDGLDISKIKLHALRSRLAIIPQDPVLFSGTVRSNLDAFDDHEDIELRDALQRVHLVSAEEAETITNAIITTGSSTPIANGASTPNPNVNLNKNPFTSLHSPITEGGLNLSQGQRQLLCLARAIVSRPKIMVLDEATSAVDMATDALIQRSIREEFGDSTLIVIAHRLSTIADFDKILVMGEGRVEEFGSPKELFGMEDGVFRSMVAESGEREKLEALIKEGN
ncbi:related to multidrug transporter (yeast bile transporter) [Rhynchosporium secalis]|uniref:Related to multidrug transporter (Yeast bile transporter) n=1 Tax=Rhynchosporium secalis TaxID=38038 RepID=A0A1E1M6T0_RHYSE|nr:related to multidrug transporter (yeast bile transporter) [Rhynchosporium secalis]